MKCSSVVGLWPTTPPPHRVTALVSVYDNNAAAVIYTGGSDGSVISWRLNDSTVWPVAILCGHSSSISALCFCYPARATNRVLLSTCADGVLCTWNTITGRCSRRRRLPPWAGAPLKVCPITSLPQYVCVLSSCPDSSGHEVSHKSAIIIVDSFTLTISQTVFHGNLVIGMVKSMAVVEESIILVDGYGKTQCFFVQIGEIEQQLGRSSVDAEGSVAVEGSHDGALAVVVEAEEKLVALVFGSHCEFKLIDSGVSLGEICLEDSSLCCEDSSVHVAGGMFLEFNRVSMQFETEDLVQGFKHFALWSTNGAALVYRINKMENELQFECIFEVPAVNTSLIENVEVRFSKLNQQLLRVESTCLAAGELHLWTPHFTMWSLEHSDSTRGSNSNICYSSSMLGEGSYSYYLLDMPSLNRLGETQQGPGPSLHQKSLGSSESLNCHGAKEHVVSSSILLCEDFCPPYAIVYGFYNGDIEVIKFQNGICKDDSTGVRCYQPHTSKCSFLGHTGAVLCLAAHRIASLEEKSDFQALISGSSDCTIRIWNLDTGSLVMVMHHHISPVRQIVMPPAFADYPWRHCFLSVGEDCCVALVSLETLHIERMFPGHPSYPSVVAWDSVRGYVACLCGNALSSEGINVLYIWDIKTGSRERIIRGAASHSMFDHFCKSINMNSPNGSIFGGTTSSSLLLLLPILEDASSLQTHHTKAPLGMLQKGTEISNSNTSLPKSKGIPLSNHNISHDFPKNTSSRQFSLQMEQQGHQHAIQISCPFPGIAIMSFDLSSILSSHFAQRSNKNKHVNSPILDQTKEAALKQENFNQSTNLLEITTNCKSESPEEHLLRFSLSSLHLWDVDHELDKRLIEELNFMKPEGFYLASGLRGDRGSVTLMCPGLLANLEIWKSSSEFSAMRSLTMVSLAQRMISISRSVSAASGVLAAFYTRNFAEKVPHIKPPLLQLLVSFWQDPSEHVRMAARSLFHCAAPRAIPLSLCNKKTVLPDAPSSPVHVITSRHTEGTSGDGCVDSNMLTESPVTIDEESDIVDWLDSYELDDWISYIEGTSQDAMASLIIAGAALVVWYPSIVKSKLPKLVVNQLVKLVMSMNDRYSSTAAELLAEGMNSVWKAYLGPEIPHLIGDIFFQIECLSGSQASKTAHNPAVAITIREALIGILLPSLAIVDILSFLNIVEGQIWSTASDSPVHLVALKTIIRASRGSPKSIAQYLEKVVKYILQTMDHGNLVMRKACLSTAMVTLKEMARIFPMVALNEMSTRLAVGDAVGNIRNVVIRVYDLESVTQIKILDASGPPGLPSLIEGASPAKITTAITALSFSPDGRWWSLGSAWWEKLNRNLVPVQCTKLILVPPWEGFSPSSSRSSIIASIGGHHNQDKSRELDDAESPTHVIHNLDFSYRLQWIDGRKVILTRQGQDLGVFLL